MRESPCPPKSRECPLATGLVLAAIALQAVDFLVGCHEPAMKNIALQPGIGVCCVVPMFWWSASPWQWRKIKLSSLILIILAMGLVCTFMSLVNSQRSQDESRRISQVTTLAPGSVRRIAIHDRNSPQGPKVMKPEVILDARVLDEFASAATDARRYRPNHPQYVRSWYLDVDTDRGHIGLECHYQKGRPREVVCYFATISGSSTHYHGTFMSMRLRPWFEKYVQRTKRETWPP